MSYFPLDRDILTSSLWATGTPEAFKVWSYLLLSADPRTGVVEDTDPGIALRCALPLDATVQVLDWLAAPDPYSRSKEAEGRRIERLPEGGIRLVNYLVRRDKDYSTPRVKRWRERTGSMERDETVKRVTTVTGTTNTNTNTNITDNGRALLAAAKTKERNARGAKQSLDPRSRETADRYLRAYNSIFGRRVGQGVLPELEKDISQRLSAGHSPDTLVAVPVLLDASGDKRAQGQLPRVFLRTGENPRRAADGQTVAGFDWLGLALGRADQVRLWDRHVQVARDVGVLDELQRLGCRVSEDAA
jgi:hypothetical protein